MDLRTERIEKDTKTVTITAPDGKTLLSQVLRRQEDDWHEISWTAHAYDFLGRKTLSRNKTGIIGEWRYNPCCNQVEWHRDANGNITTYQYDDFGRVILQATRPKPSRSADTPVRPEAQAQNQVIESWNTYNVHGQLVKFTITTGPEDENPQITTRAYDSLGRLVATTAPNGFITRYDPDANTTTAPTGVTRKTESYLDGRQKSTKVGTESYVQTNDYGVNADTHQLWTLTTQKAEGELGGEVWTRSYTNFLGQGIRTERPGPATSKQILASLQSYDDFGRSTSLTAFSQSPNSDLQPLGASSLTEYDSETGEIVLIGQDIDGNGDLEEASTDRISRSETRYEIGPDDHWWQIRQSWIWPKTGDATKVKISAVYSRSGQLGEMDENHGQVVSITHNVPPAAKADTEPVDRKTDFQSVISRATTTIVYSDREKSKLTTITTTAAGHQTREIVMGGLVRSVEQWQVASKGGKEPSTKDKAKLLHSVQYTYDALGRRIAVTDGRTGTSTITYDPKTGDVIKTTDAADNSTTYTYYRQGQLGAGKVKSITNAHGNTQYFAYNERGQKITTWGKTDYPVLYQYDAFGDLAELRTMHEEPFPERLAENPAAPPAHKEWLARYETHVTRWIRDPFTRKVIRKEYADGNGNDYVYSVDGKLIEETSARGANKLHEHDPRTGQVIKTTFRLEGKIEDVLRYNRDRLGNIVDVTDNLGHRTYERDILGRKIADNTPFGWRKEWDYNTESGAPAELRLFDDQGDFLRRIKYGYNPDGTIANVESPEGRFEYEYMESAPNLLKSMKGPVAKTTYEYEPNRNLITRVHNQFLGEVDQDQIKKNTEADRTISSFSYTNDDLGRRVEVSMAGAMVENTGWNWKYNERGELISAKPNSPAFPTHSFVYDALGNRFASAEEKSKAINASYQTNHLNQYTGISRANSGQPEHMKYDLVGNLIEDGSAKYKWDARNRLVGVERNDGLVVTYGYDYLNRRIKKYIRRPNGLQTQLHFIYNGSKPIAKLENNGREQAKKLRNFYTWGRDITGSLKNVGGVGALLSDSQNGVFLYDGNGNVTHIIGPNLEILAHYGYGPYGYPITREGKIARTNEWTFATKFFEKETEQIYFGERYYLAKLGRWSAMDPIGERDGPNVYTFVKNDPIGSFDAFGLWTVKLGIEGDAVVFDGKARK